MKRSQRPFRHLCPTILLCLFFTGLACAESVDRQTLELKVGGADIINTSHTFKRVSIAKPDVADVIALSPKSLYIFGKKVGYTSIMLWEDGATRTLLDLVVALDLTALKQKLYALFPTQKIEVHSSETGVVLTGTVSGPEVVEQALRLTQAYLPKLAEGETDGPGSGKSGTAYGITNLLKVGGSQQILLEVKFAEVTRNSDKDWQAALGLDSFGNDFAGAIGISDVTGTATAGSLLLNFAENPANIFANIKDVTAALHLLETEGLARLLAEPRLVTQSGQEASFLAGGEFPVPVPDDDGITIEFKEFGVGLIFTPIVLSDGKISLHVAPTVSTTSTASAVEFNVGDGTQSQFYIPSLSTRKLESTVQLYDGQTLALAGLLQDNIRETVQKVPGLGDIPIIGPLFRSTSYQQEKTDLLITVTPHIVNPVEKDEIHYPGEFMREPNWFEFYLEGRLEGHRPTSGGVTSGRQTYSPGGKSTWERRGGFEGEFGHQPETAYE